MPMVPSGSCTDCYWWNLQKRQWIRINEDANVEVCESMTFLNGNSVLYSQIYYQQKWPAFSFKCSYCFLLFRSCCLKLQSNGNNCLSRKRKNDYVFLPILSLGWDFIFISVLSWWLDWALFSSFLFSDQNDLGPSSSWRFCKSRTIDLVASNSSETTTFPLHQLVLQWFVAYI